jgi:hypothetical protein
VLFPISLLNFSFSGRLYRVSINGQFYGLSGTSASSPVVAGIISLANSLRVRLGGSTMGFVNPFLYSYSSFFTRDITSGNNFCTVNKCCSQGFYATDGWDPVTGLGVLNVNAFLLKAVEAILPPTLSPTPRPSTTPTATPLITPTPLPLSSPTAVPVAEPTPLPLASPTPLPLSVPTPLPLSASTPLPLSVPTPLPLASPSPLPLSAPTSLPLAAPTPLPLSVPTPLPLASPSPLPSLVPTPLPFRVPSPVPSPVPLTTISLPSTVPTLAPLCVPSHTPSTSPSHVTITPTVTPSRFPSRVPTIAPSIVTSLLSFNASLTLTGLNVSQITFKDKYAIVKTTADSLGIHEEDVEFISAIQKPSTSSPLNREKLIQASSLQAIIITQIIQKITGNRDSSSIIYSQLVQRLTKSIENGNFTETLKEIAIQFNATASQQAEAASVSASVPLVVNLSPTRTPTVPPSTSDSSSNPSSDSVASLSTGVIVGIAIAAGVIGLMLIVGIVFYFCSYSSTSRDSNSLRVQPRYEVDNNERDPKDFLVVDIYPNQFKV